MGAGAGAVEVSFRSFVITKQLQCKSSRRVSSRLGARLAKTLGEKLRRFPPVSRSTLRTCRRFTSTTKFLKISVLVRSQLRSWRLHGSFRVRLPIS